jgi:hypothetical protein
MTEQQAQAELDPAAVRLWFDVLYVDTPGLIHISSTGKWAGQTFDDKDAAAAHVAELDAEKPEGIYLRTTTLRARPAKGRGTAADSLALPGLWADLDIAGPGHATTEQLPPDAEAARKIVTESGLPDPTVWVHSGGGLYPWWLLDKPLLLAGDDLITAEILSGRWQTVLGRSAAALGWHYGTGVGDLPRILRIPGTVNRKEGLARPCAIIDAQPHRYSISELRAGLAEGLRRHPDPAAPPPVQRRLEVVRAPGHVTPNDDFEARVAWDDQMLLGGAGWRIAKGHPGSYCEWIRPGEKKTGGISATTGLDPARDRMFVFSDSAGLPEREEMTKPYVYALLHHRGDTRAATRDLARLGFGTPYERTEQRGDHAKPAAIPRQADDPEAPRAVMRTWDDLGNAKRLMDQHGHNLRWLTDANQWAAYTGTHWTIERASSIAWQRAREVVESMPELEAPLYDDEPGDPNKKGEAGPSQRDAFLAFAKNQRFRPHLTALIDVARSEPDLWAEMGQFDRDEWVLNCANGVLNLKTGELSPHRSSLMLMHQTGVAYNPNATAPNWEKFLRRVMPDSSRFDYLRRIAGYTLTGSIEEQAIFVHHGVGANGKSVFLKVIRAIFGSYGQSVPRSTLLAKASDGGIPNDVARMQGRGDLRPVHARRVLRLHARREDPPDDEPPARHRRRPRHRPAAAGHRMGHRHPRGRAGQEARRTHHRHRTARRPRLGRPRLRRMAVPRHRHPRVREGQDRRAHLPVRPARRVAGGPHRQSRRRRDRDAAAVRGLRRGGTPGQQPADDGDVVLRGARRARIRPGQGHENATLRNRGPSAAAAGRRDGGLVGRRWQPCLQLILLSAMSVLA